MYTHASRAGSSKPAGSSIRIRCRPRARPVQSCGQQAGQNSIAPGLGRAAGSFGCRESGVTSSVCHTRGGIEAKTSSSWSRLSAADNQCCAILLAAAADARAEAGVLALPARASGRPRGVCTSSMTSSGVPCGTWAVMVTRYSMAGASRSRAAARRVRWPGLGVGQPRRASRPGAADHSAAVQQRLACVAKTAWSSAGDWPARMTRVSVHICPGPIARGVSGRRGRFAAAAPLLQCGVPTSSGVGEELVDFGRELGGYWKRKPWPASG